MSFSDCCWTIFQNHSTGDRTRSRKCGTLASPAPFTSDDHADRRERQAEGRGAEKMEGISGRLFGSRHPTQCRARVLAPGARPTRRIGRRGRAPGAGLFNMPGACVDPPMLRNPAPLVTPGPAPPTKPANSFISASAAPRPWLVLSPPGLPRFSKY